MTKQRDDFRQADNRPNLITRKEFFLAQSRMDAALKWPYRGVDSPTTAQPVGSPTWWWRANGRAQSWENANGYNVLSTGGMFNADFFVLPTGGPYGDFDGAAEYVYYADASWQHFGTQSALVWTWSRPDGTGSDEVVIGKWRSVGANQRSWLFLFSAADQFRWLISTDGTAVTTLNSTVTRTAGEWHFFLGYFNPSTLMKNYHALATDGSLSTTRLAAGVPVQAFDSNADFMLGANGISGVTVANYLDGGIGVGGYWQGVPTTESLIDAWAEWLFHWTKPAYGG